MLAFGQAHVPRRLFDRFDRRADALRRRPQPRSPERRASSELAGRRLGEIPLALLVIAGALLGSALPLSLGVAQWWLLRRYVARAAVWIPANVVARLLGLAVSVTLINVLLTEERNAAGAIAVGAGAGLLMGLTVAAETGWFLVRLVGER